MMMTWLWHTQCIPKNHLWRLQNSAVGQSLMRKDWPPSQVCQNWMREEDSIYLPMLLALPRRICAVVVPPTITNSYDASCMFNPSMLLNQGSVGALYEFPSLVPFDQIRCHLKTVPAAWETRYPPFKPGTLIMPICKCKSTKHPKGFNNRGGIHTENKMGPISCTVHILAFWISMGSVPGTWWSGLCWDSLKLAGGPAGVEIALQHSRIWVDDGSLFKREGKGVEQIYEGNQDQY